MNTNRYTTKLDLYGTIWTKDEMGANVKSEGKIKSIWCRVIPLRGSQKSIGGTEIDESVTHFFIYCRVLEIKEPKMDMYFMDRRGRKYEIEEYLDNYKNRDELNFKCKIEYN